MPLHPLVVIQRAIGGITLLFGNNWGKYIPLPDDEQILEEDNNFNQVTIHLPEGDIVLVKLTLENYKKVSPFFAQPKVFRTDEEVNRYYYKMITETDL
jgi:hypothetical protein